MTNVVEKINNLNVKYINNLFIGLMNRDSLKQDYLKALKELIDFNNITLEVAKAIGMKKWDEDSDIYLFPYYLYTIIPLGLKVISIFEEELVWTDHMDSDSRLGCLAFGLRIKEK